MHTMFHFFFRSVHLHLKHLRYMMPAAKKIAQKKRVLQMTFIRLHRLSFSTIVFSLDLESSIRESTFALYRETLSARLLNLDMLSYRACRYVFLSMRLSIVAWHSFTICCRYRSSCKKEYVFFSLYLWYVTLPSALICIHVESLTFTLSARYRFSLIESCT